MKFNEYLNESSLKRIWQHNEKHDCGAMTPFRKSRDCGNGDLYTNNENLQRNKSLLAKLMSKGFGCTRLSGQYPEGGKTGKEISYFIVDIGDTGELESVLTKLGEEFEQDSVLFIPKGSVQNKSSAYLIGTNKCENNWLKYGKKQNFEKGKLGYTSPIYTSYVNGRPFLFEEVEKFISFPGNGYGWWALNLIADDNWENIEV